MKGSQADEEKNSEEASQENAEELMSWSRQVADSEAV